MIVTLTPNPSIDRTITVASLEVGEVNRAVGTRVDPGGKGVNVARALVRNGHDAMAVFPLGGPDGEWIEQALSADAVPHHTVRIDGSTRTNVAIVDSHGTTTKVNEPGPEITTEISARLAAAVPDEAGFVALCGSLPADTDPDFFGHLVARYRGRAVVDTSGEPLARAVSQAPLLIKPNLEELAELTQRHLRTLDDVVQAARGLTSAGVGAVVASLGADGAMWISDTHLVFARATVDRPLSTVGAGDCLLAGVLGALDSGADPEQALRQGVAWGAASVALPGSAVPGPSEVAAVSVYSTTTPDLNLELTH